MELGNYLSKFKINDGPKRTKEQIVADEIYEGFGKNISYGLIMRMIKEKGSRAVYMNYQEVSKSNIDKKVGAFINKCQGEKIIRI